MTDMKAYASFMAAQDDLRSRFHRAAYGGRLEAMLPSPKGLFLVGGPRNRGGAVNAQVRQGLQAAFKAAVRAERILQGSI